MKKKRCTNQEDVVLCELPKLRIAITDRCQLKCFYCGGEHSKMENFQPEYLNGCSLDYDVLKMVISCYLSNGGKYVQFTGGEPLLSQKIYDLVSFVYKAGGVPEINTNGLALNRKVTSRLKQAGLKVLKISIPSFQREEYEKITGVDALGKVFANIKTVKNVLPIRVNIVATKKLVGEIEEVLDICRYDLQIKQLLLLELLYYPHVSQEPKDFFIANHVNIKKIIAPIIERKLNNNFNNYYFGSKLEHLYCAEDADCGFQVFIKQADYTLRTKDCWGCQKFCQEGAYELRLSTGGYLNICNLDNHFGVDCSCLSDIKKLDEVFINYKNLFQSLKKDTFVSFLEKNEIKL